MKNAEHLRRMIEEDESLKTSYTVHCYAGKVILFNGVIINSHFNAILKEVIYNTGEGWTSSDQIAKLFGASKAIVNKELLKYL